jgi:hypothetical protein
MFYNSTFPNEMNSTNECTNENASSFSSVFSSHQPNCDEAFLNIHGYSQSNDTFTIIDENSDESNPDNELDQTFPFPNETNSTNSYASNVAVNVSVSILNKI